MYLLIVHGFDYIQGVEPEVVAGLIMAGVTIIGYFINRYLDRKKLQEQQIREQNLPTYSEFLGFLFEIFNKSKKGEDPFGEEFQDSFWDLNKKAILWMSDKTLRSYIVWRQDALRYGELDLENMSEEEASFEKTRMLLSFENLLLEFRKDIGHKNKDFQRGEILSLFINDIEEHQLS